jgi:hypothetical protein
MSGARVAFFKKVNQASIDQSQSDALLSIAGQVSALETGKASVADLADRATVAYVDTNIQSVFNIANTKLDSSVASSSYATISSVAAKADITYVDTQDAALEASKASASALSAVAEQSNAQLGRLDVLDDAMGLKYDAAAAAGRVEAENELFSALRAAIHIDSEVEGVEFNYTVLGLPA